MRLTLGNVLGAMFLVFLARASPLQAGGEGIFLREDFKEIDSWVPLTFPKIERHSDYTIVNEGGETYLRAMSDNSASGIVYSKTFPVTEYPGVRWRWRAERVYTKGNASSKAGDDYPLRIYVLFPYDPSESGFAERVIFRAAKALYGQYPPKRALNYIWANREGERKIIPNAFTKRAMMIVMRGPGDVGSWFSEDVNIVEDYRKAFGEDPPAEAKIAIMNDSDNTGEESVSLVDFIEIYRR